MKNAPHGTAEPAKAYSYIRMSTERQLRGDSLRRQLELSQQYAEENGLSLVEDARFSDIGVSAFTGENADTGALGRFLQAVREGRIERGSYLLVESLDRMSRQEVPKALSLFLAILAAGINIVTLADEQVYRAESVDTVQLILSITIMARAHEESQIKSRRLSAVWSSKKTRAPEHKLTKLAPAWVRLSKDRRVFEVIPDRVAIVRRIFEENASGIGSYTILRRLNDDGIKPFGRSKLWVQSYINKILANRAVLGVFQPHRMVRGKRVPDGDPVAGYFPQIVDENLFLRVQYARHHRAQSGAGRKGRGLSNLFSGLARCGYCDSTMRFLNKGKKPKGGTYLRCNASLSGKFCVTTGWPYAAFERSFLHFVGEVDLAGTLDATAQNAALRELDSQITVTREKIRSLELKRERTFALIETVETPTSFVASKLAETESELLSKAHELAVLEEERANFSRGSWNAADDVHNLLDKMREMDEDELFTVRSRLAARLREVISSLQLYVRGDEPPLLNSLERIQTEMSPAQFAQYEAGYRDLFLNDPATAGPSFLVRFKNNLGRRVVVDPRDSLRLLAVDELGTIGNRAAWESGHNAVLLGSSTLPNDLIGRD